MKLIILTTLLGLCTATPGTPPKSPTSPKKSPTEKKGVTIVNKIVSPKATDKEIKGPELITSSDDPRLPVTSITSVDGPGKSPVKKGSTPPGSPKPKPRTKSQDQEPKDHDLEQKDKVLQEKEPEKTPPKTVPPESLPSKEAQTLKEKEQEFKEKRERDRAKLEQKISLEKAKPIEDRQEKYEASKDGKFDEWLAKSKAVEMGARKLYEEAKAKVDAISVPESKQKYEKILKKILKKVEEITKDIEELEKTKKKDASEAIEKALGHFLGHFQTRAMVKSDVSELILDIARDQEDGDEVLKTLEQFLVALERSPLA
ncbi:signal peptide containing protein [Theileria equi strain WA]|uniref:Signal peptide containing protein n=1 Tax=Theileria equi strain WA TaxID=1537102 RepID=L1L9I4_THEEQ|nr:signal peptide containing protein [Theileria equi strain WA]EKX72156.1 signal peptide containing protein [Theileria equi strain WA]|eukprot:XP_004831608.1 signal peptide containing protein [Theileria equi strain WA]